MALGGFMKFGLMASTAVAMFAAPAFASDLSYKDTPLAGGGIEWSAYVQGTSDYVFRGISQNRREPALQGGLDVTYGMFYVGTFLSGVNFDLPGAAANLDSRVEVDLYAGIKPKWRNVTFDFGIITYNYPNTNVDHGAGLYDPFFYEFKAGASTTVFKDVALTGTVYVSPDYAGEAGTAVTVEGGISKPVYSYANVDFTASAMIGHTFYEDSNPTGFAGTDYTYGNVGVTAAYKAFSLDVRYWNTDLSETTPDVPCGGTKVAQCGSAVAVTGKVSF